MDVSKAGNSMDVDKTEDDNKMETEDPKGAPSNRDVIKERKYDWKETIEPHIKITVVGESGCGKSSLILAAKDQIFPHPDEKFVSKQYPFQIKVAGKSEPEMCMIAEVEAGDKNIDMRSKIYSESDVILLCYNESHDLAYVDKKWVEEREKVPVLLERKLPVILVMINKSEKPAISYLTLTELDGFLGPLECRPHEGEGAQDVMLEAVKLAREHKICEKK